MYKTILVFLDGSKVAEGILPHVENMAKRYGAKVILAQIIEPIHILSNEPAIDLVEQTMIEDTYKKTQEYFHKMQWRLRTQGIYTETRIEIGNPVKKILFWRSFYPNPDDINTFVNCLFKEFSFI
jgi:nucleotide-binding universal stress UspA family protein